MADSQIVQIRDDCGSIVQREAAVKLQSIGCCWPSLTLTNLLDDLQRNGERRGRRDRFGRHRCPLEVQPDFAAGWPINCRIARMEIFAHAGLSSSSYANSRSARSSSMSASNVWNSSSSAGKNAAPAV